MAIPILIGSTEKVERTGASFQGECPECRGPQRFFEAKKTFNVTAFLAVSLWDSEEPVVQCGQCLRCYEPDEVTRVAAAAPAAAPTLRTRVADALGRATSAPTKAAPTKASEEDELAAELAAMKKRLKR